MKEEIKKIISYYKPYKKVFIIDLLCSFISSLTVLIIPLIARYIMVRNFKLEDKSSLAIMISLSIGVVILFVINYMCNRYTRYQGKSMGASIERDMYNELFAHYQRQDLSFFDENNTGYLTALMTVDIRNISTFLHCAPEIVLDFTVRLLGSLVIFFSINLKFGLTLIFLLSSIFIFTYRFISNTHKVTYASHDKISNLNAQIEEVILGIKTTQAFVNEKMELVKFQTLNNEHLSHKKRINKLESTLQSALNSFIIGLIPIITIVSTFFIAQGLLSLSDLVTYILYVDILISPIFSIMSVIQDYQENLVGYKRFCDMLKVAPKIVDSPNALRLKKLQGKIEFQDVDFKYGTSSKNVFNCLNVKIYPGEYIALVGLSGVGKSTFGNLLLRFYDIHSGKILIDGIDIKEIQLSNLRKNIGLVPQDAFLFTGTIMENILYGNPTATKDDVISAAKKSYIHDFIVNLPDGYDSQVGSRGLKLSGGQRQRIAISRVFLKNPPILIFDEATSNLDLESERYIQKSLEKLAEGRTTIVIAHRLSTIKNAKKILVLANGRIAEEGTHDKLLAKEGEYFKFYKSL